MAKAEQKQEGAAEENTGKLDPSDMAWFFFLVMAFGRFEGCDGGLGGSL